MGTLQRASGEAKDFMTTIIWKSAAAAVMASLGPGVVLAQSAEPINADRPGLADGSKVVGPDRLQFEAGVQYESRRTGGVSSHSLLAPLLLRAGIRPNWELRLETNTYVVQSSRDAFGSLLREEGVAPVAIGAKYQVNDPAEGTTPSFSLIARLVPPSGTRSFRSRRTSGDLRLAMDWDFEPKWSFNPNVGVGRFEDEAGRAFFARTVAATLGYNPTRPLNLFVDAGWQSAEQKGGRAALIVDAGAAYLLTADVQLDFSVGRGVRGNTPPRGFVSAGISTRF